MDSHKHIKTRKSMMIQIRANYSRWFKTIKRMKACNLNPKLEFSNQFSVKRQTITLMNNETMSLVSLMLDSIKKRLIIKKKLRCSKQIMRHNKRS